MTKKIFRSICLASLLVFAASLVLIITVLYDYFYNLQKDRFKTETLLIASAVDTNGSQYLNTLKNTDFRITLIAADGTVIMDNQSDASVMENHLERQEVKDAIETGYGESSRNSNTLTNRHSYFAKRLENGNILRLSYSGNTVLPIFLGILQPVAIVIFIALLLSLALAFKLSQQIVKPLNTLDLENPLSNTKYEEITPLLRRIDSDRKRLKAQKKELIQRQAEFETVTDRMNEGIVLLSPKGTIWQINLTACEILGISKLQTGLKFSDIYKGEDITLLLNAAFEGNRKDSKITLGGYDYYASACPVTMDEKNAGITLFLFDITEKEKAEKMRKEFTANVSHELKTPLHSISGYAELIKNNMVKDEDIPVFAERIYNESARMINLVEDILKLSKLDEGIESESKEELDIYAVAEKVTASLTSKAEENGINLTLTGKSTFIHGDFKLIWAIIYNLCDNAIKYNRKDGSVNIDIRTTQDGNLLTVKDNGIGIEKEHIEHIFERFYRVDKSHSKELGGTGLGLSIVKHAALLHGAKINIDTAPQKGTEISVLFPKQ